MPPILINFLYWLFNSLSNYSLVQLAMPLSHVIVSFIAFAVEKHKQYRTQKKKSPILKSQFGRTDNLFVYFLANELNLRIDNINLIQIAEGK